MSERTRAALKVFGINATKLEEAVHTLETQPSPNNLHKYLEAQKQLFESFIEVVDILAELLKKGASASEKAALGSK
ncbi:MAG: hypothetical protein NZ570_07535 [Candidatus Caldarchaeum sp.]|nr:hypothetical protein [Candidatus Caldarchaeum sp.]MDW7978018.1 hypothetical protein [Candidatus Caldarchaeum sp.]MDW8359814.1 hypothetical protein [Candidatus Caldarchaeum sp.]